MSANLVNVTIAVDDSPVDASPAEGNVVVVPAGTMWPDTGNNPIVPAVVHAMLQSGTVTIQLVASDNYDAGVLLWDFIINVRGLKTVNVQNVPVNFASGANQNVWTILAAAGWTP